MKISGKVSALYGSNSNQQSTVKALREKAMQKLLPKAGNETKSTIRISGVELKNTLSVKEIDSLGALFGYQDETAGRLYGQNNLKNVHAGMLFDMKG